MCKKLMKPESVSWNPRFPNFFEQYKKSEMCLRSTSSNINVFLLAVFLENKITAKVSKAKNKLLISTPRLREELPLLTFLVFSTFLSSFAFSICLLPTLQSFSELQFVLVNSQTGEGCALQAGVYRATAAQ